MTAPNKELRYAFLDIGLGDCTVITWDDRHHASNTPVPRCIVVDGGKTKDAAKVLANYLIEEEVQRIDLLVVTHIDWDHLGGIEQLFRRIDPSYNGHGPPYDQLANLRATNYWGPLPKRPGGSGPSSIAPTMSAAAVASEYRAYITSVRQNQDLLEVITPRVDNLYFPAMDAVPGLDLFNNLRLDLLAPAEQRYSDEYDAFEPSGLDTLAIDGPLEALTLEALNEALAALAEERAEQADTSANNQSIVFSVTPKGLFAEHSDHRLLLTGDAELDSWTDMDDLNADRLRARYFKVPHHGAKTGLGPEPDGNGATNQDVGWGKVHPFISVLSVGQANYGHPHLEVLQKLFSMGTHIHCTERNRVDNRWADNLNTKYGDGHGGGAGYCKLAGGECPKSTTSSWGHFIVRLTDTDPEESYFFSGDDCPFDWRD